MTRPPALLALLLLATLAACGGGSSGSGEGDRPRAAATATSGASATASLGVEASGVIAFRRYLDVSQTTSAIFTVHPDGTGERQISHPPEGRVDTQPTISADGQQVAWEYCQNGDDPSCHVMVAAIDGSGSHELQVPCPGGPICDPQGPAWAPDGRLAIELAWGDTRNDDVQHSQIVVVDADGTHPRVVVDPPVYRVESEAPVWSPDGSRIAFEHLRYTAGGNLASVRIAVVSSDGGRPRDITPPALAAGDHPDWSPDGAWISFRTHADSDTDPTELAVIHPDGTGRRNLTHYGSTDNAVTSSSFSPDGRWIVFGVAHKVNTEADLMVAATDGRDARPLTQTELYESAPEWGR